MTGKRMAGLYALGIVAGLVGLVCSTGTRWIEHDNNRSISSKDSVNWETDLLNLPAEVPYPGVNWLNRISSPETSFTIHDTTYSSAYSALLYGQPLANPSRNINVYINSFFFSNQFAEQVVNLVGLEWGHYFLCYLRNYLGGSLVYYSVALIFHYFCYVHSNSLHTFEKRGRTRPSNDIIWDQIKMAQSSMAWYVLLPVFDEIFVEQGWTLAYFTVAQIGGWTVHLIFVAFYFALVEIGIYWMHRTLHTNKWMYKNIHMPHHKYNKPETLTPWASIAFHPLDGILQSSPYVIVLFLVPCHYLAHYGLLFFTPIWATYIHDAMDLNLDPIMGSKYHTVHHTHYIYNYGQIFTFCDRFWNTFRQPDGPTGVPTKAKQG